MKALVLYQSHYGTTETYAKWLAEDLGADLRVANQMNPADLQNYSTILYGGGLYVGAVNGVAWLSKQSEHMRGKEIYLFTVGSSDVTNQENLPSIRNTLQKALPPALWEVIHLYHLRGGMQYSKMSFLHRTMMKMMIGMLKKKPEHELSAGEKDLISTYGQDINFTDRTALAPLLADLKADKTNLPPTSSTK